MKFKTFAKRAARVLALGLGIPLLLLTLFAMLFGDSFIYFPSKYPEGDWQLPTHSSVAVRDVNFAAEDGTKLHAWYAATPNAKATLLVCHGNAGNVTNRYHYISALTRAGFALFIFDYRGYGKSEGSPGEKGVYADAVAAHGWLVAQGVPATTIIAYGESLGCAVAVELATRVPLAGIVLQCAFTSIGDMTTQVVPVVPMGWAVPSKMRSIDKVPKLAVPKLHFHSKADEVIPYRLGRALFDAAAEPKRWVEYDGLGHNDWPGRYEDAWRAELVKFAAEVVK
jgi:hypothetical protein